MLGRDHAVTAFERRSARPESAQHSAAAEMVSAAGGADALLSMYDSLIKMLAGRPLVRRVDVIVGDIVATVARVESAIAVS